MNDFLLELFSEEIPAMMQRDARLQLEKLFQKKIYEAGLSVRTVNSFVTPLRLGISLENITLSSNRGVSEIRGPRVNAPDRALEGFLRKNNIFKDDLKIKKTEKGEFFIYSFKVTQQPLRKILSDIVTEVIEEFYWPKAMYWGDDYSLKWVRPLRSIVAILFEGKKKIPVAVKIRGIETSISTSGHQVMFPDQFMFNSIREYETKIAKKKVLIQAEDRKKRVLDIGKKLAKAKGFNIVRDDSLLEEIIGLTEYPTPIIGVIPKNFLTLPEEVIITSMRQHQKFLSLRKIDSEQVEGFLVVSDLETSDGQETILMGNLKVLSSRLADALFFYRNDLNFVKKYGMKTWNESLKSVSFHARLGSQFERVERIVKIADQVSLHFSLNPKEVKQAAELIKADLASQLVDEFPSLQGTIGAHYALLDGHDLRVAKAIKDHYSPLGPKDEVPSEPLSVVLSLSDKIEYLTSLWSINVKPTGNKDPFALRRASLGIIRILIENKLELDLNFLIGLPEKDFNKDDLEAFLKDRTVNYLVEKGYEKLVVKAIVEHQGLYKISQFPFMISEIQKFINSNSGRSVVAMYKRVTKLLDTNKKNQVREKEISKAVGSKEDRDFATQLIEFKEKLDESFSDNDLKKSLRTLEELTYPVDKFLNNVQVNTDQINIRNYRYDLLSQVRYAMEKIAAFEELESK